jgi:hypothetical protein
VAAIGYGTRPPVSDPTSLKRSTPSTPACCDGVHNRTPGEVGCALGAKVGELAMDKLLR